MGERDRKLERKNGVSKNSLYELQSICMNISKIHRGKGKAQVHLRKSLNLSSLKDSFFQKRVEINESRLPSYVIDSRIPRIHQYEY